jgi:hypothetical protein
MRLFLFCGIKRGDQFAGRINRPGRPAERPGAGDRRHWLIGPSFLTEPRARVWNELPVFARPLIGLTLPGERDEHLLYEIGTGPKFHPGFAGVALPDTPRIRSPEKLKSLLMRGLGSLQSSRPLTTHRLEMPVFFSSPIWK